MEENQIIEQMLDRVIADPAWEYCEIYDSYQTIKKSVDNLMRIIQQIETGNPETDRMIKEHIQWMENYISEMKKLID